MEDDYLNIMVKDNNMEIYPTYLHGMNTGHFFITSPPEHINTFIARNGLAVDYIDPNYVYGRYNNLFGNWSGMIGHVRK